jgi:arylsulfatase A-like enzyme
VSRKSVNDQNQKGVSAMAQSSLSGNLNILTIITDQQRFDSLSCMGNQVVHTPNLDRLASRGALFTNATCSHPLCGPSRASLLSGLYSHGHQFMRNAYIDREGLNEEIETVDEILHNNGYHTEYHGKWHTGSGNRGCYFGGLDDFSELYKQYLDEKYPPGPLKENQRMDRYTGREYEYNKLDDLMLNASKNGYYMPHHNESGKIDVAPEDTLTAWTAQRVIRFLENKPQEPFAVTCSILHPHAPLVAAEPYYSLYDPAKMPMPDNVQDDLKVKRRKCVPDALPLTPEGLGTYISLYYGLVKEVDDWVGRILDRLEQCGLADRTLILFTSDHGELMGSHGTVSKMEMFEEAIRVPLIMSLPGVIPENQRLDVPVSGADIMPTILDFAGLEVPGNVHGRSVKGIITGKEENARDFALCELGFMKAIRSKDWKLILNPRLNGNINEPYQLYHLKEDKGEQRNLLSDRNRTDQYLKVANELKAEMLGMLKGMNAPDDVVAIYESIDFSRNQPVAP